MQPVWVLSVDLQTKTATFQSGLREAAQSARGAFSEIRSGAGEMGGEVGRVSGEARHSVMLLAEEFGVHIPRALAGFIASLGPVGAAMEAAFPFLAVIALATMLIEHLAKLKQSGRELTEAEMNFGTAANNAFNALDQKLLQAGIHSDELRNDHLGALKKQLELIDGQSLEDLSHSFDELAKNASAVFEKLKAEWYSFDSGSAGAKNSLETFKAEYESLLSKKDDKGAAALLDAKIDREEKLLALQKQAVANETQRSWTGAAIGGDGYKYEMAMLDLKAVGLGITEGEIKSQGVLVDALHRQAAAQTEIAKIRDQTAGNASRETGMEGAARQSEAAKAAADSMLRMGESSIAAQRAQEDAALTIKRGTVAERTALELDFAARELAVQQAGNAAQIAALDKSGKDYSNQLAALHEKALELVQAYETQKTEITARGSVEQASRDLAVLESSEREKIAATQQGSAVRLAAIDASIRLEQSRNLEDTSFYRDLLTQRVEVVRQAAEAEAKLRAEAGKEAADSFQKSGEMMVAADKESYALQDSLLQENAQRRLAHETQLANEEFTVKMVALAKEQGAINSAAQDAANKLAEVQAKEKALVQEHENQITAIKQKAELDRNQKVLQAETQLASGISDQLTKTIMNQQSWGRMVLSVGDEVVSGLLDQAIKKILISEMTKATDAAVAARDAAKTGFAVPGAGPVLGPSFGTEAYATMMAFEGGGIVPGFSRGDSVPAMLTPGEGVLPKSLTEGLMRAASSGRLGGGGHTYNVHVRPTYHVNTIDGDGMRDTLEKHTDQLQRHMEGALRRMNK